MVEFKGFLIPQIQSDIIEKVASEYSELFKSRREFVSQALSYYYSVWTDPNTAFKKFKTFLPYMPTKTLKHLKAQMDPTQFSEILEKAQESYVKLDNSEERFEKIENPEERHFVGDMEIELFEALINRAKVKDYLLNVDTFFHQAIDLFLKIWKTPEKLETTFFEIFEYLPEYVKNYWKENFYDSYLHFLDRYNKHKIKNQMHSNNTKENENYKIIDDDFINLINEIKNIKSQKKELEKYSKIPTYALPSPKNPLISQFVTRFFPIKLSLATLANLIIDEGEKTISYDQYSERVYKVAERLSFKIKQMEDRKDTKIIRNKKISTGLPEPTSINDINNQNMSSSKKRFLQHYVGMKKSAWIKRQRKNKNSLSEFDGALNSFGLAYFVTEPKPEKNNKFSKKIDNEIEIRVGITKKGIRFLMFQNEILDEWKGEWWYPKDWPKPISEEESKFIRDEIISEFSLENSLMNSAIQTIKNKGTANPRDIEMNFKDPITDWILKNKETDECKLISDWLVENEWHGNEDTSNAILSWRTALMGRLSELKVVNWEISKQKKDDNDEIIVKGGISQYSLAE